MAYRVNVPFRSYVQSDPDSGLTRREAGHFRKVLEFAGGLTLATALAISTVVQARVWNIVRSDGKADEHSDFRIRTEARRLKSMESAIQEQRTILAKLHEAHELLEKEKLDVRTMHHHGDSTDGVEEQPMEALSFTNPLQADNDRESEAA